MFPSFIGYFLWGHLLYRLSNFITSPCSQQNFIWLIDISSPLLLTRGCPGSPSCISVAPKAHNSALRSGDQWAISVEQHESKATNALCRISATHAGFIQNLNIKWPQKNVQHSGCHRDYLSLGFGDDCQHMWAPRWWRVGHIYKLAVATPLGETTCDDMRHKKSLIS